MQGIFSFFGALFKKKHTVDMAQIDRPRGFKKEHEARIDATGKFTGLPPKIQDLLQAAGITREEVESNFEDAMMVASFHLEASTDDFFSPTHKLMGRFSMREAMDHAVEIKKANPLKKYSYSKKEMLGKGGYGKVFKCTKRGTTDKYALKIANVSKKRQIENEIKMHALSKNHTNVVGFFDAFLWNEKLYMIVELMDGGALTDFVVRLPRNTRWKEEAITYVIREMMRGLAFMHANYHLHRDIKSDNILLSNAGDVKIADFGFAVGLTKEQITRKTRLGTPYWMAPEIILKKRYNSKVDVWATGITLLEIAEGKPPHMGIDPLKAMFLIKTGDEPKFRKPEYWSEELIHFLGLCLKKNPKYRGNSSDLMMHSALSSDRICEKKQFAKMLSSIKKMKDEAKKKKAQRKKN